MFRSAHSPRRPHQAPENDADSNIEGDLLTETHNNANSIAESAQELGVLHEGSPQSNPSTRRAAITRQDSGSLVYTIPRQDQHSVASPSSRLNAAALPFTPSANMISTDAGNQADVQVIPNLSVPMSATSPTGLMVFDHGGIDAFSHLRQFNFPVLHQADGSSNAPQFYMSTSSSNSDEVISRPRSLSDSSVPESIYRDDWEDPTFSLSTHGLPPFLASPRKRIKAAPGPNDADKPNFRWAVGRIEHNDPVVVVDAPAMFFYEAIPSNAGFKDVWPRVRDQNKAPVRYIDRDKVLLSYFGATNQLKTDVPLGRSSIEQSRYPNQEPALRCKWPPGKLPLELYMSIANFLDRDDIKAMRLTCQEFDRNIAQVLFKSIVVPFNTEIYAMVRPTSLQTKGEGKDKAAEPSQYSHSLSWENEKNPDNYIGHGLDVFAGFGRRIKRFGMSFEIDEDSLACPPQKGSSQDLASYWGSYNWPYDGYRRYDDVAGLEDAADESPKMKHAFAHLTEVQELALSLDNGLGWLGGPDRSICDKILRKPRKVFGSAHTTPDRRMQAQEEFWQLLQKMHRGSMNLIRTSLFSREIECGLQQTQVELEEYNCVQFPLLDPRVLREMPRESRGDTPKTISWTDDNEIAAALSTDDRGLCTGIMYTSEKHPSAVDLIRGKLVPSRLSQAQKEWFLETEWAQCAFLSSYMLAVIDNTRTFKEVHTLNLSRISSSFLPSLCRRDFWKALPGIKNLTIMVAPDWRKVEKDQAGFIGSVHLAPAEAAKAFNSLLVKICSGLANVKKLQIGYANGGENASGLLARNRHLLPAPVASPYDFISTTPEYICGRILKFPHLEELTLRNCWISPPGLLTLVSQHRGKKLSKLTLDSVSLTAWPRGPPANPAANANPALGAVPLNQWNGWHMNHANQMLAAIQAPAFPNGIPQGQGPFLGLPQPGHIATHLISFLHGQIYIVHNVLTAGHIRTWLISNYPLVPTPSHQQLNSILQSARNVFQNTTGPISLIQAQNALSAQLGAIFTGILATAQIWPNAPPPQIPNPATLPPPGVDPTEALHFEHRAGSWPWILDVLSPGRSLQDFNSQHSVYCREDDPDDPHHRSNITLVFNSCGYARLPYNYDSNRLDQSCFDSPEFLHVYSSWFIEKMERLRPIMMKDSNMYFGEILQGFLEIEKVCMDTAWDLTFGWEDQDEAMRSVFDGLKLGGTGRFSGTITPLERDEDGEIVEWGCLGGSGGRMW